MRSRSGTDADSVHRERVKKNKKKNNTDKTQFFMARRNACNKEKARESAVSINVFYLKCLLPFNINIR